VVSQNGHNFFVGPQTEAMNGGRPLELEDNNLYHVDGTLHPNDLMNGAAMYEGEHYLLSQIDDATLADLGFTLSSNHDTWFV
jgi:hypothetical protein